MLLRFFWMRGADASNNNDAIQRRRLKQGVQVKRYEAPTQLPAPRPASAKLAIAPLDFQSVPICLHTLESRNEHVADSRGSTCLLEDVLLDGCCPGAARHSQQTSGSACTACNMDHHCCSEYEACVRCCLHEDHANLRAETYEHAIGSPAYRVGLLDFDLNNAWAGTSLQDDAAGLRILYEWRNFTLCELRCRTAGTSTLHENRYKR
jgi:hypothetical protein